MATKKAVVEISAVDRTKIATASAQRNIEQLKTSAAGAVRSVALLGVVIAGSMAAGLKQLIDTGDQLSKLSQKTGITTEALSALRYAGQLSDVSVEQLGKGLNKLAVNMADAAAGGLITGAAFEAIGVKVRASGGHLRNTEDVLGDIADKFAGYEDGAEKAALATAIFGKAGVELIPFLNQGRKGLAEMTAEAERLGIIFSGDLARQSEQFNDNLTRMSALLDGLKMSILPGVVEWFNRIATELLAGKEAFGDFSEALLNLGLREKPFTTYEEGAAHARAEIDRLTAAIERAGGAKNPLLGPMGMNYVQQLDNAQKLLKYYQAMQKSESPVRQDQPKKTKAPVALDMESTRARQMSGRLAELQAGLKNEADLYQHHQKTLDGLFADGELSIASYYDSRAAAADAFLAKQKAEFKAEIDALTAHRATLKKPADRVGVDAQIAAVMAKQTAAAREHGQVLEEIDRDRTKSSRAYITAVYDLDAALAQLRGDEVAVARLENARQLAAAAATYKLGGGDHGRELVELKNLFDAKVEQLRINTELSQLSERQASAEESYVAIARASGAGLLDQERAIFALRSDALAQLEALAAAQAKLAQASGDPRAVLAAQKLATTLATARENVDPTLVRINAGTDQFADNLARGAEEALVHFESLRDVINSLGDDLLHLTTQVLVTDPLRESAKGFLKDFAKQYDVAGFVRGGSGSGDNATKIAAEGIKGLGLGADVASSATASLADSMGLASGALSALPATAATPLVGSFAMLSAAAQSAAAALATISVTSGLGGGLDAGGGLGFLESIFKLSGDSTPMASAAAMAGIISPFAQGGIMTSAGPLPLKSYSLGGIADRPQLALFGEGGMSEAAFVPLPDGRSIPVSMRGGPGRSNTYHLNIAVPAETNRASAAQIANRIMERASFAARRNS